jgi:glutathione S-transferase
MEQVNNQEKKTQTGGDYWTINPKGQVPCLELDSGETLTEGPVIVQYVADQKAAAGLAGANPGMAQLHNVGVAQELRTSRGRIWASASIGSTTNSPENST